MFAVNQKNIFSGNKEVRKGFREPELEPKQTLPLSSGSLDTVIFLLAYTKRQVFFFFLTRIFH